MSSARRLTYCRPRHHFIQFPLRPQLYHLPLTIHDLKNRLPITGSPGDTTSMNAIPVYLTPSSISTSSHSFLLGIEADGFVCHASMNVGRVGGDSGNEQCLQRQESLSQFPTFELLPKGPIPPSGFSSVLSHMPFVLQ